MSETMYVLCALTSVACAWLLLTGYRRNGHRLLFWSGLCFIGLTINNLLLVVDKLVLPDMDLLLLRNVSALVSMMLLLYGLIYEKE